MPDRELLALMNAAMNPCNPLNDGFGDQPDFRTGDADDDLAPSTGQGDGAR